MRIQKYITKSIFFKAIYFSLIFKLFVNRIVIFIKLKHYLCVIMPITSSVDVIFRMFVAGKMSPFYKRYYPGMLMYASRNLGDELDWMAEDMVQDAVMDAFNKRHSFKDAEQWRAHILSCIHNRSVSAKRRLAAMRNYTTEQGRPENQLEDDASRSLIEYEMLDALYAAIQELPDEYRTLLRLSFEEGMKNSEIAERLGVAEITVKKRKARMFEMLRAKLGGHIDAVVLTFLLNQIFANKII